MMDPIDKAISGTQQSKGGAGLSVGFSAHHYHGDKRVLLHADGEVPPGLPLKKAGTTVYQVRGLHCDCGERFDVTIDVTLEWPS